MTMARAVVASDVGDLPSVVVDGETGLTVPAGDPHALAQALARILDDPELAERLGREGHRRLLENSSWDAVARIMEHALDATSGDMSPEDRQKDVFLTNSLAVERVARKGSQPATGAHGVKRLRCYGVKRSAFPKVILDVSEKEEILVAMLFARRRDPPIVLLLRCDVEDRAATRSIA